MFCALDVLFFTCHHLESMTLQPSRVSGLVDAVSGHTESLLCHSICQFSLASFSVGLLLLLCKPDMWHIRSHAGIADGKRSTADVIFHVSLAYIPTDTTIALYNHTFVSVLVTDDVYINHPYQCGVTPFLLVQPHQKSSLGPPQSLSGNCIQDLDPPRIGCRLNSGCSDSPPTSAMKSLDGSCQHIPGCSEVGRRVSIPTLQKLFTCYRNSNGNTLWEYIMHWCYCHPFCQI